MKKKYINKMLVINNNWKIGKIFINNSLRGHKELKFLIKYKLNNILNKKIKNKELSIDELTTIFNVAIKYKNKKVIEDLFFINCIGQESREILYNIVLKSVKKLKINNKNKEMFDYLFYDNFHLKGNNIFFTHILFFAYNSDDYFLFNYVLEKLLTIRGKVDFFFYEKNYLASAIEDYKFEIISSMLNQINFMQNKKWLKEAHRVKFNINNRDDRKAWSLIYNDLNIKMLIAELVEQEDIYFQSPDLEKFYKNRHLINNVNDF